RGKGLNLFARHLVARGEATPALATRAAWYALGHRLGWLDGGAVLRRVAAAYLTGRGAEDLAAQGEAWFAARGAAAIYPEARALVERHRHAGTPVALLSGGMDFSRRSGGTGAWCGALGRGRAGDGRRDSH